MGFDLGIVVVAISLSTVLIGTVLEPVTRKAVLVGQAVALGLALWYGLWFEALVPLVVAGFYWFDREEDN